MLENPKLQGTNAIWCLLLFRMALDTGGRDLAVFLPVFHLQLLVTALAIVVKGEFQVELLLSLRQLFLAFDCWFIVAFHALVDFISFFPSVLPFLVHVMALGALDFVLFRVLLVCEGYRALGVLLPELGLDGDHVGHLLFSCPAQA